MPCRIILPICWDVKCDAVPCRKLLWSGCNQCHSVCIRQVLSRWLQCSDDLCGWLVLCHNFHTDTVWGRHLLGGHWCDSEQYMHTVPRGELLWSGGDECDGVCCGDILPSRVWECDDVSSRVVLRRHWAIKCDSVRSRHVLGGDWCDG